MPLRFDRWQLKSTLQDPGNGFRPVVREVEVRVDPLTGRTTRLIQTSMRTLTRPDVESLVAESVRRGCFFCPGALATSTPRWPAALAPEGKIGVGEAVAFPNLFPFDQYSGVVVMGAQHHVPMEAFSAETLANGFVAAATLLRRVAQTDREALYGSISWNYMTWAGGSFVHPHLQMNAGPLAPEGMREDLAAAGAYLAREGRLFWDDLLAAEQAAGERYLGRTGAVEWLVAFAPRATAEVVALLPGGSGIAEVPDALWADLGAGLALVLRGVAALGAPAFNFAVGGPLSARPCERLHGRLVPRAPYSPLGTSDFNFLGVVYREPMSFLFPETVATTIREAVFN